MLAFGPLNSPPLESNTEKENISSTSVGVLNKHQLVNLYYCALGSDGVLKDTRFILVQAECPNVQFAAARVISTKKVHSRGY